MIERADRQTAPLVEGRFYLVPTVRAKWFGKLADWPVIVTTTLMHGSCRAATTIRIEPSKGRFMLIGALIPCAVPLMTTLLCPRR